jgi:hypothetical protein
MNISNYNNNNNIHQTPLNNAYQFSSFSSYIQNGGLMSSFSPTCIFCSSNNTVNLINDGSFKQCKSCKKQFKSANASYKNNIKPPYK